MANAKRTIDHDEIQRWVEKVGGFPATVASTEKRGEPGVLRIDFPGYSGEGTLERIDWDDWFGKFEESGLAFLYQEETADHHPSRFIKLVRRTAEDVRGSGPGRAGGGAGRPAKKTSPLQMEAKKAPAKRSSKRPAKRAAAAGRGSSGRGSPKRRSAAMEPSGGRSPKRASAAKKTPARRGSPKKAPARRGSPKKAPATKGSARRGVGPGGGRGGAAAKKPNNGAGRKTAASAPGRGGQERGAAARGSSSARSTAASSKKKPARGER